MEDIRLKDILLVGALSKLLALVPTCMGSIVLLSIAWIADSDVIIRSMTVVGFSELSSVSEFCKSSGICGI